MRFYILDVFAEEKYQGNQLMVVLADHSLSSRDQQAIAREIDFPETSFILSGRQENGGYDVRIWTANTEVPFAGHPTIGTAHIIREILEKGESDRILLNMKAGQIPVRYENGSLVMSQNQPEFGVCVPGKKVAEVFGLAPEEIREDCPVQWASTGLPSVCVPLKDRESLRRLRRSRERFEEYVREFPECYCNHIFFVDMGGGTLAARCLTEDYLEDAATGSANGNLAGYLLKHGCFGADDVRYTVIQGEDMGRKSVLAVRAALKNGRYTIEVGGRAFIVAAGEWEEPHH